MWNNFLKCECVFNNNYGDKILKKNQKKIWNPKKFGFPKNLGTQSTKYKNLIISGKFQYKDVAEDFRLFQTILVPIPQLFLTSFESLGGLCIFTLCFWHFLLIFGDFFEIGQGNLEMTVFGQVFHAKILVQILPEFLNFSPP